MGSETRTGDVCEAFYIHADSVAEVSPELLPHGEICAMADTFKLLGDPTRLRVIQALSLGEFCVCDLAAMLDITQTALSNHLRLLRNMRLVHYRRAGKMAYYSLADCHLTRLVAECLEHVHERVGLLR